jgi:LmbE family N-acetylglucosaminyl deacetylase
MMKKIRKPAELLLVSVLWVMLLSYCPAVRAQPPATFSSADILQGLQKLKVLGTVLYVAAHPDDENTRLLAWLSKDRLYRTGYLSITRGDGGQNLIGEEQGVALGMIRTQELLAARRIDGAEQFFTRGYDFGFSKSTEEALKTWNHDKVLGDVVWVIRKFKPDVIITRFPEDQRAGHGHHSGSAVLAREAFKAAADPKMFPEQLQRGVTVWQAKRILWNTFNFGNNNTITDNQFKIDVGTYNPLLGKGYGEIAAESRSQHKSQGFGVPSSRGSSFESFVHIGGDSLKKDLLDGVDINWGREKLEDGSLKVDEIIKSFSFSQPELSVKPLVELYKYLKAKPDGYWRNKKLAEVQTLIEACAGLYFEASAPQAYAVQGDSLRINVIAINRSNTSATLRGFYWDGFDTTMNTPLAFNKALQSQKQILVDPNKPFSQPYWLSKNMEKGSFNVEDESMIGLPENPSAYNASFNVDIEGERFIFTKPIRYKHTDPVKGELFQPLPVVPPVGVNTNPSILVFRKNQQEQKPYKVSITSFAQIDSIPAKLNTRGGKINDGAMPITFGAPRGVTRNYDMSYGNKTLKQSDMDQMVASLDFTRKQTNYANHLAVAQINYDHIPSIRYFVPDGVTVLNLDIKTSGTRAGYIKGAGDKVPEALEQLGYNVTFLEEKDITPGALKNFDVIVVGIRAYNIHEWMNSAYETLMDYVKNGGTMVVQYNTNSFVGPVRSNRIGPYNFSITNGRVTDEESAVQFVDPASPILNWPNKITEMDFKGWVQERGIYFADKWSPEFKPVLGMRDPGETEDRLGSTLVASYGKGRFVYTGLALFRQLPAAVGGSYRLFANIIANPNYKK